MVVIYCEVRDGGKYVWCWVNYECDVWLWDLWGEIGSVGVGVCVCCWSESGCSGSDGIVRFGCWVVGCCLYVIGKCVRMCFCGLV